MAPTDINSDVTNNLAYAGCAMAAISAVYGVFWSIDRYKKVPCGMAFFQFFTLIFSLAVLIISCLNVGHWKDAFLGLDDMFNDYCEALGPCEDALKGRQNAVVGFGCAFVGMLYQCYAAAQPRELVVDGKYGTGAFGAAERLV
ncbi:hypothetical protein TrRE_jg6775 [Triparma retinervis]|uniref:Uncharacterized protein n=1 Tax=Triparma retinervis TaxID=2557542 RepID=A0A9W7L7Z2_9STRA|nr:hypothetical protein TrRE_jg6775 [Triparma retinervis]